MPWKTANSILITSANGSSRLVGKHAIIDDIPSNSTVHGGFMLLASSNNPYFINASMSSPWYKKFIELYIAGGNGAIGNLNKNDLDNYDVWVPKDNEQIKIGFLFKSIDSLITLHQREHHDKVRIPVEVLRVVVCTTFRCQNVNFLPVSSFCYPR